jgi:hypothetical protein
MNAKEKELRKTIRKFVKESITELEMGTASADTTSPKPLKAKGGLTTQQLGGSASMRYAEDFIEAIKDLDEMKKSKAIAFVLARIGMNTKTLQQNLGRIKSSLKQYGN